MCSTSRNILCFQDVILAKGGDSAKSSDIFSAGDRDVESYSDPAQAFFEMANVPVVGYRVGKDRQVLISQDTSAQNSHTGGIVWEAAYLFVSYLIHRSQHLGKVLEVGAGCGLVGLVLSASRLSANVVMTETTAVLQNLTRNVLVNTTQPDQLKNISPKETLENNNKKSQLDSFQPACTPEHICAIKLRWDHYKEDIAADERVLCPHSFDTIVGTDVLFSRELVDPLLKTIRKMSHSKTSIYLCVPIRCTEAHSYFLERVSTYNFECSDLTEQLVEGPCSWGSALDCKLFQLLPRKRSKLGRRKRAHSDDANHKHSKNEQL